MNKRRKYLLLTVVALLMVGVGLVVTLREQEPEYNGKKLSEWARVYVEGLETGSAQSEHAARAICHIGTNAKPYLLKWVRYKRSGWLSRIEEWLSEVLGRPAYSLQITTGDSERVAYAIHALAELDADGRFAAGELENLMGVSRWQSQNPSIAFMFAAALTNSQSTVVGRHWVVFHLGLLGTNGASAIPALLPVLADTNASVRRAATNALRRIDPEALKKVESR